jgi:hypothetical protein
VTLADQIKLAVLNSVVKCDYDLAEAAENLQIAKPTIYSMFARWELKTPQDRANSRMKHSEYLNRCELIRIERERLQEELTCSC